MHCNPNACLILDYLAVNSNMVHKRRNLVINIFMQLGAVNLVPLNLHAMLAKVSTPVICHFNGRGNLFKRHSLGVHLMQI